MPRRLQRPAPRRRGRGGEVMATEKRCERCGKQPQGYDLLDYCAECSRDLCDDCMAAGCCGHVPARSGTTDDAGSAP